MATRPRLSVIIPAFNHLDKVLLCLHSLQALATDGSSIEYIVQDDASPCCNMCELINPDIASTARNAVNHGFPGNANAAADRAKGEILFFINQDVFGLWNPSCSWDVNILKAFADKQVAVAGAKLLYPSGKVQSAGGGFDVRKQPYHRFMNCDARRDSRINEACKVSWVTGAALATRHAVWKEIGGFNTAYGKGYFEDVEYCLQASALGYTVWYQPLCALAHEVGSTGGSHWLNRNATFFKRRWLDAIVPDCQRVMERLW